MSRTSSLFFVLVIFAYDIIAAPVSNDAQATILKFENTNDGKGNYEFSYETSNGLTRHEVGELVNPGQPDEHISVKGDYSYTDIEGNKYTVTYAADENGYQIVTSIIVKPGPSGFGGAVSPQVLASLLG